MCNEPGNVLSCSFFPSWGLFLPGLAEGRQTCWEENWDHEWEGGVLRACLFLSIKAKWQEESCLGFRSMWPSTPRSCLYVVPTCVSFLCPDSEPNLRHGKNAICLFPWPPVLKWCHTGSPEVSFRLWIPYLKCLRPEAAFLETWHFGVSEYFLSKILGKGPKSK